MSGVRFTLIINKSLGFLLQAGRVKHKPGIAGQVQGEPCRGSKGAEPFAGRDGAKTCALVKKRAGAAKKVPQNRP